MRLSASSFICAGLAITVLATLTDVGGKDAEGWAKSAQNFLICLEMLLFSIAHFYCFPTDEWEPEYRANFKKSRFGDSIALGDFLSDIKLIMKGNLKKKKKKKQPSEPTVQECDEENEDTEEGEVGDDENEDSDVEQGTEETSTVTSEEMGGITTNSERQEIEDARDRLLQSGLLDDLLFVQPREASPTISVSQDESSRQSESQYGSTDEPWTRLLEGPSESSNLMPTSSTTASTTPLRPSIFTTIAALSEKDEYGKTVDSPSEK